MWVHVCDYNYVYYYYNGCRITVFVCRFLLHDQPPIKVILMLMINNECHDSKKKNSHEYKS